MEPRTFFVGPGFRVVCVPPILREAPASFLFSCPICSGNLVRAKGEMAGAKARPYTNRAPS